jgi:hypothetical protein
VRLPHEPPGDGPNVGSLERKEEGSDLQISNCIVCNKVFQHESQEARRCPECEAENERALRRVKDIILENPGLTVQDLSNMTGLPYRQIMEWIQEGRIIR